MVLPELIETLRAAYDRGSVNDFWYAWNMETESSLYHAYCGAGGPLPLVGGRLRARRRPLGGGAFGGSGAGWLYRVNHEGA